MVRTYDCCGEITYDGKMLIAVDTEADAATDTLSNINGGSNGDILSFRAINNDRTIEIPASTGTIRVPAGGITLDNIFKVATFVNDGFGRWLLTSYQDNT